MSNIPVPTDPTAPSSALRGVTPHATNMLPASPCRGLWVGTAGDISVIAERDTDPVIIRNVPAGTLLPIKAKAVRATGTTASNIVALY